MTTTPPGHTLDTVQRPLADLRPHPRNARNGDTDVIRESLRVNGQYRPIVTTTDGTILAGNHTYAAAAEEGWESLACVVLDLDPDGPDALHVMLADNRTADRGTYDEGALLDVLAALSVDAGLAGTGYSDEDLAALRDTLDWTAARALDDSPGSAEFPAYDPEAPTSYRCPSCAYEWSGTPR